MSSNAEPLPLTRSSVLMNASDTALVVIDVQEKLWPHIHGHAQLEPRIKLLVEAARVVGVDLVATEQYRKGLGPTLPWLRGLIGEPMEKMAFSAGLDPAVMQRLDRPGLRKVLLVGIEAHVCVQQTAMDLLASGFQVYLAADAVGSRRGTDCAIAIERMSAAGVTVTTSEAAVFEWLVTAGTDTFKAVSALVKSVPLDAKESVTATGRESR